MLIPLFDFTKQFETNGGTLNVGGFLKVFRNNTDTLAPIYEDMDGTTIKQQPVTLDSNGRAGFVYVAAGALYRLEVYSRTGALLWTIEDMAGIGAGGGGGGDPTTITSRDGSVTVEKTGSNYDLSVAHAIDGAVLYSEQNKTEAQKATARDNIDAQQKLNAGANVTIQGNTISATDTKYTAGTNVTISNNVISATDTKYTAGENVTITNNVISATDTKYTAGANITIEDGVISSTSSPYTPGANLNVDNNIINVNSDSCTTNSTTSVALGSHTIANGNGQVVVGKYNATSNSDLFQVGGGTDDNARKNLLNVQGDGKLYLNTEAHVTNQSSIIYDGYYYGSDLLTPAREGFSRLAAWQESGTVSNAHGFDIRIDSADNTFSHIISSRHFKLVWLSGNVAVKYLAGNNSTTQITNGILLDLGGGSGQEISPHFPQVPILDDTWMYNAVSAPFFLFDPYTYATAPLILHFGKSAAIVGTETDISYSYSFIMWGLL